jgi:hypothetical protein
MAQEFYYVYQHRRLDNNQIFYVGKGKNLRKDSHKNRNKHWHNIANSIGFISEILIDNVNEEFALLIERETIHKYKFLKYNLTNYTDGGEGVSGYKHTLESKMKMSESAKRRGSNTTGMKMSDIAKENMSKSHKGKPTWNIGKTDIYSAETLEKMKNKKIGLFSTYFWWTNGISNTRSKNWPGEGWIKGRTKRGNSSI